MSGHLRRWALIWGAAVALGAVACLDFDAAFDDCVASGSCADDGGVIPPTDSGTTGDAGADAGTDAGFDAGSDAGMDSGVQDAGSDAGVDAGCPVSFCLLGQFRQPRSIFSMWSVGEQDVWASGTYLGRHHWDGSHDGGVPQWMSEISQVDDSVLRKIWGTNTGTVWTVGLVGHIFQRTPGGGWFDHRTDAGTGSTDLQGIAGLANNVWVVGQQGTLLEYNGTAWSRPLATSTATFNGIWVDPGSGTGWIVGLNGELRHLSGGTWSPVQFPGGQTPPLKSVWGSGPEDVYAISTDGSIFHHDGGTWTAVQSGLGTLNTVWGSGPSDVFVGGPFGKIHHFNGTDWDILGPPGVTASMSVLAFATPSPHVLLVSGFDNATPGAGFVLHYARK